MEDHLIRVAMALIPFVAGFAIKPALKAQQWISARRGTPIGVALVAIVLQLLGVDGVVGGDGAPIPVDALDASVSTVLSVGTYSFIKNAFQGR